MFSVRKVIAAPVRKFGTVQNIPPILPNFISFHNFKQQQQNHIFVMNQNNTKDISNSRSLSSSGSSSSRNSSSPNNTTKIAMSSSPITSSELLTESYRPISKSLIYFRTYLTIAYYLCLSPFTIIYNSTTFSFEIYKTKYQNIICAIIHFFVLFQFTSHCRGLNTKSLNSEPSNYFEVANVLAAILYFLTLFPILWKKQKQFQNVFNFITKCEFATTSSSSSYSIISNRNRNQLLNLIQVYGRALILCSLFLSWATYSVVTGKVSFHKYYILQIPFKYIERAGFVYLFQPVLKNEHENNDGNLTIATTNVFDFSYSYNNNDTSASALLTISQQNHRLLLIFLTIWYIFIEFYIWLTSYFADLLVLISGLFIRQIVRDFVKKMRDENSTAINVFSQYLCLKKIVQNLNQAVGTLVLCVVVAALPYYASNIDTIFTTDDILRMLRISFYCTVFFLALVTASDGNLQITALKDWLMDENRGSAIPQSSLILMINELNSFGLNGNGFFTISFGFFGTILSVLLTYSFIIVQFHSAQRTTTNLNQN